MWRLRFNFELYLIISLTLIKTAVCKLYFFEVIQPPSLRYTFEIQLARDFGVDFASLLNPVRLVYAEPPQCCSELYNAPLGRGAVLLAERGECSFVSKAIIAEQLGAHALIVTDSANNENLLVEMVKDETGRQAGIPAVYLPGNHGRMLRQHFLYDKSPVLIKIPLNLTYTPLDQVRRPPWDLW